MSLWSPTKQPLAGNNPPSTLPPTQHRTHYDLPRFPLPDLLLLCRISRIALRSRFTMAGAPLLFPILCLTAALIFTITLNRSALKALVVKSHQFICRSYLRAKTKIQQWARRYHSTITTNGTTEGHYELVASPDLPSASFSQISQPFPVMTDSQSSPSQDESEYTSNCAPPSSDGPSERWDGEDVDGWIDILVDKYVQRIQAHFESEDGEK